MTDTEFERLMRKGRETNEHRSQDECNAGWAPPETVSMFELLRTASFAIEAGIRADDKSCLAEGLAMIHVVLDNVVVLRASR